MTDLLFVYGTLMHRSPHPMARELARRARLIGEGRVRARLYLISHYPGVITSDDTDDIVFGDVFATDDAALLAALDDYEGCGPDDDAPTEYARVIRDVTLADGTTIRAWVYVYNWPVDPARHIASGRFELG
jgi:gamma-glutamylcyclotransferase (GGCT)/AIG2-like uncharacterized protein YtfP